MPARGNLIQWLTRVALGLLLALAIHGAGALPGLAQAIEVEPVFLDGLFLFDVPAAGDLTAVERALAIGTNLTPLVNDEEPVLVQAEIRGSDGEPGQGNPVILAGDRYIMTVTNADVEAVGAASPEALADRWVQVISDALSQAKVERQSGFLTRAIAQALAALAIALGLHWLLGYLWHRWLSPLINRFTGWGTGGGDGGDAESGHLNLLFRLTLGLARAGVWLATAAYVADLFPLSRRVSYQVLRSLRTGLFERSLLLGSRSYSLLDLLLVVITLLGVVVAASAVTNLLRSRVLQATGISLAAQEAIAVLSKYTLILLGTVVILQLWGLDLSSIALIASGLGIGVGLGLQGLVKDFVSGLVLVFERPVQVGDFVDLGQLKGTVARIGSRSTEIRTLDQVSIIVPNSHFLDSEVTNWSHGNPVSRIRLPVGVAYSADPQQLKLALLEACKKNQEILSAPAPQVFFLGFGDNALEFQLMVWIAQPSRQLIIKSDLYFAIEASLRQHGIEIPFPQRDLHIRSGHLPIDLSPETQQFLQGLAGSPSDRPKTEP